MTKFPATIKTASNAKTVQNASPSALEGRSTEDDEVVLFDSVVTDRFCIFRFVTKRGELFML